MQVPPPKAQVMDLIFGRWRSQVLYAGVRLGIFDALAGESRTSEYVATTLSLDSELGYRLMRALASLDLLREDAGRRFSLTDTGQFLRQDHPETLRGATLLEEGPEHYALWKHLPDMVRDGKQNAFLREFGCLGFEHADKDPTYGPVFDAAMSNYSATEADWVLEALAGTDFSGLAHICDVAGGQGYLLVRLLEAYPHLTGTVLERAGVLEHSESLWGLKKGLGERCQYAAGDMFEEAPAADAYFMKHILHDWNDEECIRILSAQAEAASENGRVFIAEYVITDPDTPHFSKFFDIHMMCWGSGRERTSEEYGQLLEQAGWCYVTTHYPASAMMGVVEGAIT